MEEGFFHTALQSGNVVVPKYGLLAYFARQKAEVNSIDIVYPTFHELAIRYFPEDNYSLTAMTGLNSRKIVAGILIVETVYIS